MEKGEIQNLIKNLIEKTGVTTTNISINESNAPNTWFEIEVNEPQFFISNDAEALHALNHLVRRIALGENREASIMIDINGFQRKRIEDIRAIAHMMSERARYFKSNIEFDPMSSFERRVVHEFLAECSDLKSESTGFGRTRRVVIKYIGTI
jgi:spoIIIJ-associated protein